MKNTYKAVISTAVLSGVLLATPVSAAVYEFHFTGKYTLLNNDGSFADQQSISSTLTYDASLGVGFSADLSIEDFVTFGATATVHDISLQRHGTTNLVIGNMLVDWNVTAGIPLSMVWDATGLFNAIDLGLQAGDVISGTYLKRNGQTIADVGSATPASDALGLNQGPAPLAVSTWNTTTLCTPGVDCMGNALSGGAPFSDDGIGGSPLIDSPFLGVNINFDIGSGNSLTVLSISEVPVPAALWLLGSGLIGLFGVARRKAQI
ncbi:MAG TPA: VPLPA-CTERM sorting domain-containing protein [Gammaproteobacteria bacterium]|nr:VPLPA-CTERM sorting domain-containing protein [Gammaproteobacteria bacterium]